jgi:hypothetical protein
MPLAPFRFSVLLATASGMIVLAACASAGTPVELTPATQETCPTCPPPIVITVEPSATATPEPSPTPTITPTVFAYPTRAPRYSIQRCYVLNPDGPWAFSRNWPVSYTWCVLNLKFGQDGFMMVDVYFSGNAGSSDKIVTLPPAGPLNLSMQDDTGSDVIWTKRGGCALLPITTHSGKGCSGWLIFPAPSLRATRLTFYDPWYGISMTDISLVSEVGAATPKAAP